MMASPARKLGKQPPRHDLRTLFFSDLFDSLRTPVAAQKRDWTAGLGDDLGMMLNNLIGDCGFAGQAHAVQTMTNANGKVLVPTDADVEKAYESTGYTPGDPSTDNGVVLLEALKNWRNVGIGGHQIGAFAKVDTHNVKHIKLAIDWFGGVYTGAALPMSAQTPGAWVGAPSGTLTGDSAPGSWGGHCMWCPTYDDRGVNFVTWGARQPADWQWVLDYMDECWVVVSTDWVNGVKPAPSGVNIAKLNQYLGKL